MPEKVVVTGLGAISPIGNSAAENWQNAVAGTPGVGPLTLFDPGDLLVRIACEVKSFTPENHMPAKEARRRDRFEQFATVAAAEAVGQSGLAVAEENAGRIGVIISSAIGGLTSLLEGENVRREQGARRISPFVIPMLMSNGASGMLSIDYGFKGPTFGVVSACASGADGIGVAWMMIRAGVIDAALVGGSEACITPLGMAAFDRVGAMSRRNDDYSMTPQPFDKNRDGLVMGEGAAVLVIESESHAKKRRAEILAELAGYGSTADSFHITAPSEDGAGGAAAIRQALNTAGVNPEQVDYINAHGTGTSLNDLSETKAIKNALGNHAYRTMVSSTKSMTGHMMGATGALEAIFCVQAVRNNLAPPTIHYQTPDPECDLDIVPNQARPREISVAISDAFGFGGHNAVLVIRKYQDL
jgi:beta-ketoacyl-acyl-carrier-protein synthase II